MEKHPREQTASILRVVPSFFEREPNEYGVA